MAVKLILTQIMKDESHVAKRMLDSIKNIVPATKFFLVSIKFLLIFIKFLQKSK